MTATQGQTSLQAHGDGVHRMPNGHGFGPGYVATLPTASEHWQTEFLASDGNVWVCKEDGVGGWRWEAIAGTETFGALYTMPAGIVTAYGGSTAPTGFLLCDGASYLRADYPDLFDAIDVTFGAADASHFNVPDLRGRVPVGVDGAAGRISVMTDTLGASGGTERHLLTSSESGVPAHLHPTGITHFGSTGSQGAGGNRANAIQNADAPTQNNTAADASATHQNMQPSLFLNWIIKTGGVVSGGGGGSSGSGASTDDILMLMGA